MNGRACLLRATLAAVVVLAALQGCVTPGPRPSTAPLLDGATMAGVSTEAPAARVASDWWRAFGDPQLDLLVQEGVGASPTLAVARARVGAAAAVAESIGKPNRPELGASAGITRERLSATGFYPPPLGGETFNDAQYGLTLSWDLDLWGRKRSSAQAAEYRQRASALELADAELVLSTAIARAYLEFDHALHVLDNAHASRESRAALLKLTLERRGAGLDTDVEVETARGAVSAADGEVASAEESIGLLRHQLAALVGQGPGRGAALGRPQLKPAPSLGQVGELPANLVARRADIAASRLRVEAAARDVEVARTAFYPNINLSAAIGMDTVELWHLLNGANRFWNVGPAISLPLYGHAALRGNLHGADSAYDQAVATYNGVVLDAFHQVADQLESLQQLDRQEAAAHASLSSLRRAYDLAMLRYRSGLTDYLGVLIAQDRMLAEQRLVVDVESRRADLTVNLVRALGGGFGG